MKKKLARKLLALFTCMVMCMGMSSQAFAAGIPYANIHTTSNPSTATINTSSYGSSIGHFSIETQGYSSSTTITVVISYGNNRIASYVMTGNGKRENIGINQNFYYPAGTYTVSVSAYGGTTTGWTGVWLYH